MRSTWRTADRVSWTLSHWFLDTFRIHPTSLGEVVPKHSRKDKVPYLSRFMRSAGSCSTHAFRLPLEVLLAECVGRNLRSIELFGLYTIPFSLTILRFIHVLRSSDTNMAFSTEMSTRASKSPTPRPRNHIHPGQNGHLPPRRPLIPRRHFPQANVPLYPLLIDFSYYWFHRATKSTSYGQSTACNTAQNTPPHP